LAKKAEPGSAAILRGVPAVPGIAVGPARILEDPLDVVTERRLAPGDVEGEIDRFRKALQVAGEELTELRETTRRDLDEETARIFDVQLAILEDPLAVDRTVEAIRAEHLNAEFLFLRHMREMREGLSAVSDSFFRDRGVDLKDVKQRVLRHLSGVATPRDLRGGILITREMTPSDAVLLEPDRVLGFATELGGATSHAAIMARARGIPAVVGVKGLLDELKDGDEVALDGLRGTVEIKPSPARRERLRARRRQYVRIERKHARLASAPAETLDGRRVKLAANMELPIELDYILERGAEGIGLFRTEFFFMLSHRAPTEDEQVQVYGEVLERVGEKGVIIRALDVGGDKMASYLGMPRELNPFLGMRGIRYLVAHPRLFLVQLRAILRAARGRRARILLPMVSSLEEVEIARGLIRKAMATLRRRRVGFDTDPELGVMIEVPSAVMMADELAQAADFLSVGSNDLIQFMLAIDRGNQALIDLYRPHHPAVLRALKRTVDAGHRHGIPVSICGEMAGDLLSTPLLVGLGFDQLSVSPYMLPDVKQALRSVRYGDCLALTEEALRCRTPQDVTALVRARMGGAYADLLHILDEAGRNSHGDPEAEPRRITPAGKKER
jgi:phosphotransferase system enzyme I (PtsI)